MDTINIPVITIRRINTGVLVMLDDEQHDFKTANEAVSFLKMRQAFFAEGIQAAVEAHKSVVDTALAMFEIQELTRQKPK